MVRKLTNPWMTLWLVAPVLVTGARVYPAPEPIAPEISELNRAFLMRLARRVLDDTLLDRERYVPAYVPGVLRQTKVEAVVRLRDRGYLLANATAGPAPPAESVADAVRAAIKTADQAGLSLRDVPRPLLIEIEVAGPPVPILQEFNWTKPRAVAPFIEPGVHGMVLMGPNIRARFCPSEIVTSDMIPADALKELAQRSHDRRGDVAQTRLYRFRTLHWYQSAPGKPMITLHRGLSIVDDSDVSLRGLDDAIQRIADYMIFRQYDNGLFSYQYEPATNHYSDGNNLVRQVGAAMAMAVYAKASRRSAALAATDRSLAYHLRGLTPMPGRESAAFIASDGGENKLGVTALLALAMAEHPAPESYADARRRLVQGMLHLQRSSGMFLTAFPPAMEIDTQEYFPGQALLALAAQYRLHPSADVLDAFRRALTFYRDFFRGQPSPAFVPWQVQAYAIIATETGRADYAGYVFELTDWLAAKQLSADNCRWPELYGGIAAYQPGRVGVATAAYLEGFADALRLARTFGDTERADRYERIVRSAARFVMQLQFRPEEAYFVRSPVDAVGGIRTSPALNLLRIDHCQHALVALIKTRDVLYAPAGRP